MTAEGLILTANRGQGYCLTEERASASSRAFWGIAPDCNSTTLATGTHQQKDNQEPQLLVTVGSPYNAHTTTSWHAGWRQRKPVLEGQEGCPKCHCWTSEQKGCTWPSCICGCQARPQPPPRLHARILQAPSVFPGHGLSVSSAHT